LFEFVAAILFGPEVPRSLCLLRSSDVRNANVVDLCARNSLL